MDWPMQRVSAGCTQTGDFSLRPALYFQEGINLIYQAELGLNCKRPARLATTRNYIKVINMIIQLNYFQGSVE